jgi:hypothetical protein
MTGNVVIQKRSAAPGDQPPAKRSKVGYSIRELLGESLTNRATIKEETSEVRAAKVLLSFQPTLPSLAVKTKTEGFNSTLLSLEKKTQSEFMHLCLEKDCPGSKSTHSCLDNNLPVGKN